MSIQALKGVWWKKVDRSEKLWLSIALAWCLVLFAMISREELEKLPRHMRPEGGQQGESRGRRDTTVRVTLDGRPVLDKTYRPSGLRGDGPTFVYEELDLPPGRHRLEATLEEAGGPARSDATSPPERRLVAEVEVSPGSGPPARALEPAGAGLAWRRAVAPGGAPLTGRAAAAQRAPRETGA